MRYADHAYAHIQTNTNDPGRSVTLDKRAQEAGFKSATDYIDDIQGRSDTRSFEGVNNRVCWANARERLYGWHNRVDPSQSTVIPKKTAAKTIREFENHKKVEAQELGISHDQIKERGPIPENRRDVALDRKTEQARAALKRSFRSSQKDSTPQIQRQSVGEQECTAEDLAFHESVQRRKTLSREDRANAPALEEHESVPPTSGNKEGDKVGLDQEWTAEDLAFHESVQDGATPEQTLGHERGGEAG
ncbi:hypothetical protein QEV83_14450 [Methylocapsa sp. D3K7]|uniref:hypothetical protein n=1 Tax=Methylocapsa sp. D3K7 TaxID=3041435 RepID=UPI00244E9746|nr:hypothetical protein [Methylocapsa sp. D3K7]WGJ13862.1 hypothetical protein QEV83_14450 [Methylocapsa sp. D3K7]